VKRLLTFEVEAIARRRRHS